MTSLGWPWVVGGLHSQVWVLLRSLAGNTHVMEQSGIGLSVMERIYGRAAPAFVGTLFVKYRCMRLVCTHCWQNIFNSNIAPVGHLGCGDLQVGRSSGGCEELSWGRWHAHVLRALKAIIITHRVLKFYFLRFCTLNHHHHSRCPNRFQNCSQNLISLTSSSFMSLPRRYRQRILGLRYSLLDCIDRDPCTLRMCRSLLVSSCTAFLASC